MSSDEAYQNTLANALDQATNDGTQATLGQGDQPAALYEELSRVNNELVNLQRELAKRNAELEQLNRLKNQFLGMAAHDLRNPLTVILTCSRHLQREASELLGDEEVEFLSIIRSYSEFMLQLVEDLLDVTAIESGRLELYPQPTDLIALAERSIALNRVPAENKQIRLFFHHRGDLPELVLDRLKMEQVLNNLVSNAVKFSYPGSPVEVHIERQQGQIVISVRDQGPGIPPDELDRLFKWFGRTSVRGTGGERSAGLGLAISKRIVLAHQGRIWVESEVGRGSSFHVALPIQSDYV